MRFDVILDGRGTLRLAPHYCRDWDENGGCHGMNPDHGLSFEEARAEIVAWYEREAQDWREKTLAQWLAENGYDPSEIDEAAEAPSASTPSGKAG